MGGHGQLGLQQHRVEAGRGAGGRPAPCHAPAPGAGEQLAEVLLVEAGAEEVGVGVGGRGRGRANREGGAAVTPPPARGLRGLPLWLGRPGERGL